MTAFELVFTIMVNSLLESKLADKVSRCHLDCGKINTALDTDYYFKRFFFIKRTNTRT